MEEPRLNRLSIVLDEFDLDQVELAQLLEVNKDTVSRWCRNANQPKLSDLYRIAKLLRIDIRRLIEPTDWKTETGKSVFEVYNEKKKLDKTTKNLIDRRKSSITKKGKT
jgi:transcriptional regulator with XRE-family HTH domain